LVFRILLVLAGLFFLFIAVFIYEDGNKKIQNKLADIYLEIQIIREKYSTIRALMLKANEIIGRFFDKYFDSGRLTLNFIGISGLLYVCFLVSFMFIASSTIDEGLIQSILAYPLVLLYYIIPILIVLSLYKRLNKRYPVYFFLVVILFVWGVIDGWRDSGVYSLLEFPMSFVITILCVKLNIMLTKWNINLLVNKKRSLLIIPSLALIMVALEFLIYGMIDLLSSLDHSFLGSLGVAIAFIPSVLLIVVINTAFIILFLAIAINKVVFPLVAEPIRALYEHNLIKNKKLLAAVGFLLLFIANPQLMENPVVSKIKDLFK